MGHCNEEQTYRYCNGRKKLSRFLPSACPEAPSLVSTARSTVHERPDGVVAHSKEHSPVTVMMAESFKRVVCAVKRLRYRINAHHAPSQRLRVFILGKDAGAGTHLQNEGTFLRCQCNDRLLGLQVFHEPFRGVKGGICRIIKVGTERFTVFRCGTTHSTNCPLEDGMASKNANVSRIPVVQRLARLEAQRHFP